MANIGVHGAPVCLRLERLWSHNITITTRLVETVSVPRLPQLIQAGRFDPTVVSTRTFPHSDERQAYDFFSGAGETGALKVAIKQWPSPRPGPWLRRQPRGRV